MLKIFRSSKKDALQKGVGAALPLDDKDCTALNEPFSFSSEDPPDKATTVLMDFIETIFKEGAHNWSPEEREKRVDACLAEVRAIQRAEDRSEPSNSSNESLRPNIVDLALSVDFDGHACIYVDFLKASKNVNQMTPEEIEKLKATYDSKLAAFKRAECARLYEGILRVVKHEVSLACSQNTSAENTVGRSEPISALPNTRPIITKQLIKKIADQMDFG